MYIFAILRFQLVDGFLQAFCFFVMLDLFFFGMKNQNRLKIGHGRRPLPMFTFPTRNALGRWMWNWTSLSRPIEEKAGDTINGERLWFRGLSYAVAWHTVGFVRSSGLSPSHSKTRIRPKTIDHQVLSLSINAFPMVPSALILTVHIPSSFLSSSFSWSRMWDWCWIGWFFPRSLMSKMSIRNGRNAFDCPETRRPRRHFPHRRHFSPVPPEGVSYYLKAPSRSRWPFNGTQRTPRSRDHRQSFYSLSTEYKQRLLPK